MYHVNDKVFRNLIQQLKYLAISFSFHFFIFVQPQKMLEKQPAPFEGDWGLGSS
jgi:hypothetical protein